MIDNSKNNKKLGWVITGSGHFFEECLDIMSNLGEFDLFVSKAADEVIRMYKKKKLVFLKILGFLEIQLLAQHRLVFFIKTFIIH